MSDIEVQSETGQAPGLTQGQRVAAIFSAPSKTFEDIKGGNTSWWLPFLLFVIVGTALWATVGAKVTWETVTENGLRMSPKQAERLESLPPDQQARQKEISATVQKYIWLCAPVGVLLMDLIAAGVLLGTINFGFGGRASFGKVLAVVWYAGLPGLFKLVIGLIGLFAGVAPESFFPSNPAGTNLGYYLPPVDTNKALYGLAVAIDPITIWSLVLTAIGLAIVAGKKRSDGYLAVFGWWALLLIVSVGISAMFS
jgi:Yip1 domain